MYLSLENQVLIPKGKILGIFDLDTTANAKTTHLFLKRAEDEGRVISVCQDLPRSFVAVIEDFGNITLYLSGFSGRSLQKRYQISVIEQEGTSILFE